MMQVILPEFVDYPQHLHALLGSTARGDHIYATPLVACAVLVSPPPQWRALRDHHGAY